MNGSRCLLAAFRPSKTSKKPHHTKWLVHRCRHRHGGRRKKMIGGRCWSEASMLKVASPTQICSGSWVRRYRDLSGKVKSRPNQSRSRLGGRASPVVSYGVSDAAQTGELIVNKLQGYITDPELLERLGEPSATDDEGYVTDPDLLKQLSTPVSRFVGQGEAAADEDWEPMPSGGFKPQPGIWDSFLAGLERGVSGAAQTG